MIPTDEIISMVEECGLPWTYVPHDDDTFSTHVDGLVAFAALVSARAAAIEREACAKVCEDLHHKWHWGEDDPESGPHDCAKAIRAQGDQHEQ